MLSRSSWTTPGPRAAGRLAEERFGLSTAGRRLRGIWEANPLPAAAIRERVTVSAGTAHPVGGDRGDDRRRRSTSSGRHLSPRSRGLPPPRAGVARSGGPCPDNQSLPELGMGLRVGAQLLGGRLVTVSSRRRAVLWRSHPFTSTRGCPLRAEGSVARADGTRRRRYRQMFELAEALVDPSTPSPPWRWSSTGSARGEMELDRGRRLGRGIRLVAGGDRRGGRRVTAALEGQRDVLVMDLGGRGRSFTASCDATSRRASGAPTTPGARPAAPCLLRASRRRRPRPGARRPLRAALRPRPSGQGIPHPDYFSDPAVRAFVRRVAHRLAAAGRLSLGVVELDGRRVAVRFQMEMGGVSTSITPASTRICGGTASRPWPLWRRSRPRSAGASTASTSPSAWTRRRLAGTFAACPSTSPDRQGHRCGPPRLGPVQRCAPCPSGRLGTSPGWPTWDTDRAPRPSPQPVGHG